MTVEAATYISQLNASLPLDGDSIAEGDNHVRLVKSTLVTSIGSLGAAPLTVTAAQVNDVPNKSLRAGDTYTGTHNFTGAIVTVPSATTANQPYTKAQVDALVITAAAPVWIVTSTAVSKTLAPQERCRVTASGQTITFPSSPVASQTRVGVEFATGVTGTLDPGSNNIKGSAGTMTCNRPGMSLVFTYLDSTVGWVLGA